MHDVLTATAAAGLEPGIGRDRPAPGIAVSALLEKRSLSVIR